MDEKQKVGNPPKFKGDGVAVWVNKDKNNKTYLTVQLMGKNGIRVNCFEYEPEPKVVEL